jgi:iron complex transport system substrate-binding protein
MADDPGVRVKDDLGNDVVLTGQASRIVSLSPHLTEILFALGVGKHIVGTVRYSDYPEQAKKIPRLGDAFSVNVESVLSMQPDLIFSWYTGGINRSVERLKRLGIPVYVNESSSLTSLADGLLRMGTLVGASEKAQQLKEQFLRELGSLKVSAENGPRVFFQISDQDLYTVNESHLIGQTIKHCGGQNLFPSLNPDVTLVSKEAVVAGQPDLILITQVPGTPDSPWIDRWQRYERFEDRIRTIDPNLISRPSFRMLDGIREVCRLISALKLASKLENKL